MTPFVTIVTPIAPYHKHLVSRVIYTVRAQTIPCTHILVWDEQGRGAGAARNEGLAHVKTDFVVFLDADDEIMPDYIEKMLTAYRSGHYVYSDWYAGDAYQYADCPWTMKGDWHVITSLLPTDAARYVGMFDEALTGGEDSFFTGRSHERGFAESACQKPCFTTGAKDSAGVPLWAMSSTPQPCWV